MRPCDALSLPLCGTTVIEASAGTGKTYTITTLVLRLLLERELPIGQILVVTYTRAATAELRHRIRRRLTVALRRFQGEPGTDVEIEALYGLAVTQGYVDRFSACLDRALGDLDDAPVLTIHGFCQRVLSEHAFDTGASFDATLSSDESGLLDEIAQDYYARELVTGSERDVTALRDITPDKLRALCLRAGHGTGLRLIPEAQEVSLCPEAWRRQRDRCAALWRDQREALQALVCSLHGVSSKNAALWTQQMDDLLRTDQPGYSDPLAKGFEHFTRQGVDRKRSAKTLPDQPFIDEASHWLTLDQAYVRSERALKVAFRLRFLKYARSERAKRAKLRNERTFDGLLSDLDTALCGERGPGLIRLLRERFRVALVDEFQDTDPLQTRIFRTLFGADELPLLLIGDPKQAIYGFRGADVFAYLRARDAAGGQVFTLDVNRRSDGELVDALNCLYARIQDPFAMAAITYRPVSAPPAAQARFVSPDGRAPVNLLLMEGALTGDGLKVEIARGVSAEIATLLASESTRVDDAPGQEGRPRPLQPRDLAVLCRTNAEARLMQQHLTLHGVPSALQGDASVFETEDAQDLERVLVSLAHPNDARALRSMLCSIYCGLDAQALAALQADDARWDEHRQRVHTLSELLTHKGIARAMRAWTRTYAVEKNLLDRPDGPRRITNLWHLIELLSEVATHKRLHALGVLRALRLMRKDATMRGEWVGEAHELRLETSEDAVLLTTIHKSKGLEYPIVYVPFAWDGAQLRGDDKELLRFHDTTPEHVQTLDLGSDEHEAHQGLAEDEALAEGLRLLYVALTRAKHRVSVVVPTGQKTSFDRSALGYLLLGGGARDEVAAKLKALSPETLTAELASLCLHAPGAISTHALTPTAPRTWRPTQSGATKLEARPLSRSFEASVRTASFSSLIAGARRSALAHPADRDALTDDAGFSDAESLAPYSTEGETQLLTLDAFPRGAIAGQLMHEVLEHYDFTADAVALSGLVDRAIVARGYDAALAPMLTQGLGEVVRTPLDASGLRLQDVRPSQRVNEMEFVFPVHTRVTPRTLEGVFRAEPPPSLGAAVLSSLGNLAFETLSGFLRGYIDLVFVHEGRYFIADHKSNRLGPRAEDYDLARMTQEMTRHQYFLQYHLYVLSLHRHLVQRLRGYRYEQHMGGAFYLFLRGMAPTHSPFTGVFFDRPSARLITALDDLMGTPTQGRP